MANVKGWERTELLGEHWRARTVVPGGIVTRNEPEDDDSTRVERDREEGLDGDHEPVIVVEKVQTDRRPEWRGGMSSRLRAPIRALAEGGGAGLTRRALPIMTRGEEGRTPGAEGDCEKAGAIQRKWESVRERIGVIILATTASTRCGK